MERAILVDRGKESLVSAADYSSKYHGRRPFGTELLCPLCRQPLICAAMSKDARQTPHFRHQYNNPRSQECEYYATNYGEPSTYQRAPLPMFIRQSDTSDTLYIVEAGFRAIRNDFLSKLNSSGAILHIGNMQYKITSSRFEKGMTIIPFDGISLSRCSELVWLSKAPLGLNATWGYPEDAVRAMVFTRDSDSRHGKRIGYGDSISLGSKLFIVCHANEAPATAGAFPNAKEMGTTRSLRHKDPLKVISVELPDNDREACRAIRYLHSCGFEVHENDECATMIWPPAISEVGNTIPLFNKSKCIFSTNKSSSPDRKLYIQTSSDMNGYVRTEALLPALGPHHYYCTFKAPSQLSVIATKNWPHSSVLLLHPSNLGNTKLSKPINPDPIIDRDVDGTLTITVHVPSTIDLFKAGKPVESISLNENSEVRLKDKHFVGAIRITQKQGFQNEIEASHSYFFQKTKRPSSSKSESSRASAPSFYASRDKTVALARSQRRPPLCYPLADKSFALIREKRSNHDFN